MDNVFLHQIHVKKSNVNKIRDVILGYVLIYVLILLVNLEIALKENVHKLQEVFVKQFNVHKISNVYLGYV